MTIIAQNAKKILEDLGVDCTSSEDLEYVNFSHSNLTAGSISVLSELLSICKNLQTLKLGFNELADDGAAIVASALCNNNTITCLDLGFNGIGDAGAAALSGCVAANNTLKVLYLSGNVITQVGFGHLGNALKVNVSLCALHLTGNAGGPLGAAALAEHMSCNHSLEVLYLKTNKLGSSGMDSLASSLASSRTLKRLYLGDNKIEDIGVITLCPAFREHRNMQVVELSFNSITELGIESLVNVLYNYTSLTVLQLDNNRIGNNGAKRLAKCLESMRLQELYVGFNEIETDGILEILRATNHSNTINILMLSGNTVNMEGATEIANWLFYNRTLHTLFLDHMNIGQAGKQLIAGNICRNVFSKIIALTGIELGEGLVYAGYPPVCNSWSNEMSLRFLTYLRLQFQVQRGFICPTDQQKHWLHENDAYFTPIFTNGMTMTMNSSSTTLSTSPQCNQLQLQQTICISQQQDSALALGDDLPCYGISQSRVYPVDSRAEAPTSSSIAPIINQGLHSHSNSSDGSSNTENTISPALLGHFEGHGHGKKQTKITSKGMRRTSSTQSFASGGPLQSLSYCPEEVFTSTVTDTTPFETRPLSVPGPSFPNPNPARFLQVETAVETEPPPFAYAALRPEELETPACSSTPYSPGESFYRSMKSVTLSPVPQTLPQPVMNQGGCCSAPPHSVALSPSPATRAIEGITSSATRLLPASSSSSTPLGVPHYFMNVLKGIASEPFNPATFWQLHQIYFSPPQIRGREPHQQHQPYTTSPYAIDNMGCGSDSDGYESAEAVADRRMSARAGGDLDHSPILSVRRKGRSRGGNGSAKRPSNHQTRSRISCYPRLQCAIVTEPNDARKLVLLKQLHLLETNTDKLEKPVHEMDFEAVILDFL